MSDIIENLVMFRDSMQRTLIAVKDIANSTDDVLVVTNPLVVNYVPQGQNGAVAIQLLPSVFREFMADKSADIVERHQICNITFVQFDGMYDIKLYAQYKHLSKPSNAAISNAGPAAPPPPANANNIVKLFDD